MVTAASQRSLGKPLSHEMEQDKNCVSSDMQNGALAAQTIVLHQNSPPELNEMCLSESEDPNNWTPLKKLFIMVTGLFMTYNAGISSGIAGNIAPAIAADLGEQDEGQFTLATGLYVFGLGLGPFLWAPLSEYFGRKSVLLTTFGAYCLFNLACALAPSWPSFLTFRIFAGMMGSSVISVLSGVFADIFHDPRARGKVVTLYMAAAILGPVMGPIVSAYLGEHHWRRSFRTTTILGGAALVPGIFIPETFAPTLLRHKVSSLQKRSTSTESRHAVVVPAKYVQSSWFVTLTRPIQMLFCEAICFFCCLYMAFVYALYFFFIQAYPLIFQDTYGLSGKEVALLYLFIGVGGMLSAVAFAVWDTVAHNARRQGKKWSCKEEYLRLPTACIGAPFVTIGLFWLAWTARPSIHWIVPALAGVPFGFGYQIILVALANYMTDAYRLYAASATASSTITRSFLAAVLPFGAKPMYHKIGIGWGTSIFGFFSLLCAPIPFAFICYGERIRARSSFARQLRNDE